LPKLAYEETKNRIFSTILHLNISFVHLLETPIKNLSYNILLVDVAWVVRELSQKPRRKADISASAVLQCSGNGWQLWL